MIYSDARAKKMKLSKVLEVYKGPCKVVFGKQMSKVVTIMEASDCKYVAEQIIRV